MEAPPRGSHNLLPGVRGTDRRGDTAVLTTTDPEATLRALLADGVPLPALEVRGASLEDAVVGLTGGSR